MAAGTVVPTFKGTVKGEPDVGAPRVMSTPIGTPAVIAALTTLPSGSVAVCATLAAVPTSVATSLQSAAMGWFPLLHV